MKSLFKLRTWVLIAIIVGGIGLWQATGSFNKGGTSHHPKAPADVDQHLHGNLNYRLAWTPVKHGPTMAAVTWPTGGTTTNVNPYWHSFEVAPGTEYTVTAKAVPEEGVLPGWLECWMFDRHGQQLAHNGPTDAPNGCTVIAVAT